MSIPMPGHPVLSQEEDSVLEDCRRLHDLIDSHDAVFLLTDTRESRWLPTLLCANFNKVFIFILLFSSLEIVTGVLVIVLSHRLGSHLDQDGLYAQLQCKDYFVYVILFTYMNI